MVLSKSLVRPAVWELKLSCERNIITRGGRTDGRTLMSLEFGHRRGSVVIAMPTKKELVDLA